MSDLYRLDDQRRPVPESDVLAWGRWFEIPGNRRVAKTVVGPYTVSTVFLAVDHSFALEGPPVLWETMVFGDNLPLSEEQDRCSGGWEQAEAMHGMMVRRVEEAVNKL